MIVIVPTNRPDRVSHVLAQFDAQTYEHAELCFCPAPGMSRAIGQPHAWLAGTRTIGDARNLGLAYARNRGHDWAVFWDDDNSHGPDYLAEVARESRDADVLSKGLAFVRHDSGLWLYSSPLRFFPGHSTAVRIACAEDFPAWSRSEDVEWSARMQRRDGLRVKHLPPWGLVYERSSPGGHAYDASEAEFLRAHGPARAWPYQSVDLPPPMTARDADVFAALERRSRFHSRAS